MGLCSRCLLRIASGPEFSQPPAVNRIATVPIGPPRCTGQNLSGPELSQPCDLAVQMPQELSATFELSGYQARTVFLQSKASPGLSTPHLAPNPVYAQL